MNNDKFPLTLDLINNAFIYDPLCRCMQGWYWRGYDIDEVINKIIDEYPSIVLSAGQYCIGVSWLAKEIIDKCSEVTRNRIIALNDSLK